MTASETGQRSGWPWGSYSLGEFADAVWRVADALGSSVEPTRAVIEPPRSSGDLVAIELVVREPLDVRHLAKRVSGELTGIGWVHVHPELWTAEVNQTMLTVRVDREL